VEIVGKYGTMKYWALAENWAEYVGQLGWTLLLGGLRRLLSKK
jgi:hypothetical protein